MAKAAYSRAESDWLVGINATRAMTAFNSKAGGFQLTPVGRVQTPTLAILVEREKKIRVFKPRTYFEVFGDFDVKAGQLPGPLVRRKIPESVQRRRCPGGAFVGTARKADAIREKCVGKNGHSHRGKETSQSGSLPCFTTLTSLQRDANGRFSFSARRTLPESPSSFTRNFKVLTYPRTDSRYLPEDYLVHRQGNHGRFCRPRSSPGTPTKALASGWVKSP